MNYYSVCLGEVGAGKSSFINSVLKYGNKYTENYHCRADSDWKGVTKELDEKCIDEGGNKFYFIDTPGLNEANVDEQNKKMLRRELSGDKENMSRIRCIILIMKITDYRLTEGIQQIIIELMNCFPSPDFWDHVLIIRTHCFNHNQINKVKGNIEQSIKQSDGIQETMKKKGIKLPDKFFEFYVNSVDDKENINSDGIGPIINEIKRKEPLYDNVEYTDLMTKREGNIIITYKIMKFRDYGSKKVNEVEVFVSSEGAEDTIIEKVGDPFSKTCKKGKFQKYQKYQVTYDQNGNVKDKVESGLPYDERV